MADLYIDYSRARPTVEKIKSLGCVGAVRYLSDRDLSDGITNPKDITASEAQTLLDGGLSLALVWETTASRAGAGFDAGVADAKAAEAQADALGYPGTAVIFYVVDHDATVSAVMPYFDGIKTVAKRPIGVYGGYDIIHGLIHGLGFPYGWQTRAWSEGEVCSRAHLYQRVFEPDWDLNDVLQPFPAWSKPEDPPPALVERIPVNTGRLAPIITGGSVTTAYGVKGSTWAAGYHTGEDWNAPDDYGKPAYSAVEGKVVFAGTSGGWGPAYGKHVIVQDATSERTAHCHLCSIIVGLGENVVAGQELGLVGNTGNTTGAHVHVERRHRPFTYGSDEKPARDLPRPANKVIKTVELVEGSFCDSVYWLAYALNKVKLEGGRNLRLSGRFDKLVGDEVAKFQIQKCGDPGDRPIGPLQIKALLEHAGLTGFTVT
ncbi:MAG TPA: glycoside hydrolase domain-containing protein [Thermomicrobiales bacterium]|nr:glycoside hydrolase domain-containing protein [Thermomicrobiales bacterium]